MNHEIDIVEQDPTTGVEALYVVSANAFATHFLHDRIRDAADVSIGRAGSNHEEVGRIIETSEVQYDYLAGFQVIHCFESGPQLKRQLPRLVMPGRFDWFNPHRVWGHPDLECTV